MFHHYPDNFEIWEDPAWEECSMVEICLSRALQLSINQIKTADAWQQYEEIINTEISEEKYQAEIYREDYTRMHHLVRTFWQQHFADLVGHTIEFPQFKTLKMGEKLTDILADTDPQIVEAIGKIGLPGIFSNKVKDTIRKIAQASLNAP
jgi:DNA-directed RNA polymerase subunit L